jgi:NitT/TauT family transport system substrate-binding protein
MKSSITYTLTTIAVAWLLSIASAGAQTSSSATAAAPEFVIGSVLEPNINIPILVAEEQGFFKKYGVPVVVKLFPSGADIVQSMAGGSVEFAAIGGVPATILASRGTDVRVIARLADISYANGLGIAKGSSIKKPQDIEGKTVSMTYGTDGQYLVLAFAKHWGIPLDSFKTVNLSPPDQVNALAQGSVQMISVWEPFTSRVKEMGGTIVQTGTDSYWPGAEGPVSLVGVPGILIGRERYLDKNPETVHNLLRALNDATDWAHKNPEQAAAIAAKRLNTSNAAMLRVIKAGHIYFNFDKELVDELRGQADFLRQQGIIPKDFQATSWLAPQFMMKVLPGRVTYRAN